MFCLTLNTTTPKDIIATVTRQVKSAYKPSFLKYEVTGGISTPLDGMVVHHRVTVNIKSTFIHLGGERHFEG